MKHAQADSSREFPQDGEFRVKVVENLADGLAHDFKNLLQVITGSALIALEYAEDRPDQVRELHKILEATDRGGRMVRKLLAQGQVPGMQIVPVNLNDLILNVTDLLGPSISRKVLFKLRLNPRIDWVLADPDAVEQVLVNLLLNARDAMPAGGWLTVETGPPPALGDSTPDTAALAASSDSDRGFVRLAVSDNGLGMTPEVMERMFDPYFTTKEGHHGSGVGLYMARSLVHQLHGEIRALSEPGRGTTVEVLLPALGDEDSDSPLSPQDVA